MNKYTVVYTFEEFDSWYSEIEHIKAAEASDAYFKAGEARGHQFPWVLAVFAGHLEPL